VVKKSLLKLKKSNQRIVLVRTLTQNQIVLKQKMELEMNHRIRADKKGKKKSYKISLRTQWLTSEGHLYRQCFWHQWKKVNNKRELNNLLVSTGLIPYQLKKHNKHQTTKQRNCIMQKSWYSTMSSTCSYCKNLSMLNKWFSNLGSKLMVATCSMQTWRDFLVLFTVIKKSIAKP
jgi:hypothetical protein